MAGGRAQGTLPWELCDDPDSCDLVRPNTSVLDHDKLDGFIVEIIGGLLGPDLKIVVRK